MNSITDLLYKKRITQINGEICKEKYSKVKSTSYSDSSKLITILGIGLAIASISFYNNVTSDYKVIKNTYNHIKYDSVVVDSLDFVLK